MDNGQNGQKSITIRLDDPELIAWAEAQSSAQASAKTAIKVCMFQYGKDKDLLNAILEDKFSNHSSSNQVRQTYDNNQNHSAPIAPVVERVESEKSHTPVAPVIPSTPPVTVEPQGGQVSAGLASLL